MCGSRKNLYPPKGGLLEIPQGRGSQKEGMNQNWNFERGGYTCNIKPSVGGIGCNFFSRTTQCWIDYRAKFSGIHVHVCQVSLSMFPLRKEERRH